MSTIEFQMNIMTIIVFNLFYQQVKSQLLRAKDRLDLFHIIYYIMYYILYNIHYILK